MLYFYNESTFSFIKISGLAFSSFNCLVWCNNSVILRYRSISFNVFSSTSEFSLIIICFSYLNFTFYLGCSFKFCTSFLYYMSGFRFIDTSFKSLVAYRDLSLSIFSFIFCSYSCLVINTCSTSASSEETWLFFGNREAESS